MKKTIIIISALVIILLIGIGGYAGWSVYLRKLPAGETCRTDNRCVNGLKCLSGKCSSGAIGSFCGTKTDCKLGFCVNSKCSEGKAGDSCSTYKDCQEGLLCKQALCTVKPSYTKYFDKIAVSKIKMGMPPGPNNVPVATTRFARTDAIEIDITDSKNTTGQFWVELVNPVSGEKIITTDKQHIGSPMAGTGLGVPGGIESGEYELNVYFNNELVYTTNITIQ